MKKSKSTKKQFVKQEKPTDDELADRWITKYPNTIHILGGFRRYGNGFWPEIHHPTVEAEILGILEAAKQEKIRPNKGLKNSVMDLARIKTTKANERMDDNPSILVLKNGTLDLGTYELLDHDQDFHRPSHINMILMRKQSIFIKFSLGCLLRKSISFKNMLDIV
jgi:phage/plasmid-associated DNA primase